MGNGRKACGIIASLTAAGGLVIGNLSQFFDIFRYFDSKPSSLVGYVSDATDDLTVHLDNTRTQIVDHNDGFFRFDDILPGTHSLRFEHAKFRSFTQPVRFDGPGEHLLSQITLPKSLVPPTGRTGEIMEAVALAFSADGSEPLAHDIEAVNAKTGLAAFTLPSTAGTYGWVYVGENRKSAGIYFSQSSIGATAEVEEATVLRSAPPVHVPNADGFTLGKLLGSLRPGQKVIVKGFATPAGEENYWVRVGVIDDPE